MATRHIRVLVIEDDPGDVRLLMAMLEAAGDAVFDIETRATLSAGIRCLAKAKTDVVLLDLSLPDSSGLDTFARLHKEVPNLPIVVITGLDDESIATKAVKKGAQDYLIKGQVDSNLLSRSLRYAVERHQTQQELAQSSEIQHYYHALLEHTSDVLVVVNGDGAIRYMSPAVLQLTGSPPEDFVSRDAFADIHPDDLPQVMGVFTETLKQPGYSGKLECRFAHKDGTWRHVEAVGSNLIESPSVKGFVISLRDITERKEAEEALREAQKRYDAIFHNPVIMVNICDEQGIFLDANDAAIHKLGYTRDDLGKKGFLDLIHPEDQPMCFQLLAEVMEKGYMDSTIQVRMISKSGEVLWLEVYGCRIEQKGEYFRGLAIARDITEAKRAEEALRQSEEKLRVLVDTLRLSQEAVSTPVVQLWDNVLALPLIGIVDEHRAQRVMEVLLRRIVASQSEMVLLDVTGVTSMDTQVASYIMQTVKSASMLGTRCVLTGIQPDVAQTVVELGLDMNRVVIKKDMREGLRWALAAMGYQVRNGNPLGANPKS